MATSENLRSDWLYYKLGNCTICNGNYITQNFNIRSALTCLLSLVDTIKVSVITVGILYKSILSFEGFVRNVKGNCLKPWAN